MLERSCRDERTSAERVHGAEVLAGEQVVHDRLQLGRGAAHDRVPEAEHDARVGKILRRERGVEIGPRRRGDDRRERDALGRRTPERAAAVRVAVRADVLRVDPRPRLQPVEELANVLDLARPVDPDEPSRLAVPARVERERRVALRHQVCLGDLVDRHPDRVRRVVPRLAEAVQEHDRRPSACGRRAVRDVVRRHQLDAVAHLHLLVDLREGGARSGKYKAGEDQEKDESRHLASLQSRPWIPAPWASSTPAPAG